MPVRRKGGYYKENPEQSQLAAQGVLAIPPTRDELEQEEVEIPVQGSPPCGYVWEILRVFIPATILVEVGGEKGDEPTEVQLKLSVSLGAQELFSFTKLEKLQFLENGIGFTNDYANYLFTESPPIAISVPGGQQLSLRIRKVSVIYAGIEAVKKKVHVRRIDVGFSTEFSNFFSSVQEPGFINYRYN